MKNPEESPKSEAREWTLCFGEYDDPAWNGPMFDGYVNVIEKSAYTAMKAERDAIIEENCKQLDYSLDICIKYNDAKKENTKLKEIVAVLTEALERIEKNPTGVFHNRELSNNWTNWAKTTAREALAIAKEKGMKC